MIEPDDHPEEAARLKALQDLGILDTASEERFDRITRLARHIFKTDIALVSLVDKDRQWFKSAQGLPASETSRAVSFCGHAVAKDEALVVENAAHDERFSDNPLVTGDPNIRFYAGHPLHSEDGWPLGTLCVINSEPKTLSEEEKMILEDLAKLVESELVLSSTLAANQLLKTKLAESQKAVVDETSRAWSQDFITDLARSELSLAQKNKTPFSIALLEIDRLDEIKSEQSEVAFNAIVDAVAQRLRSGLGATETIGRFGESRFLIVLPGSTLRAADRISEGLRKQLRRAPFPYGTALTGSFGVTSFGTGGTFASMLKAADKALGAAIIAGRDWVCAQEPVKK